MNAGPGPCLVTGATGLMGSHLIPALARTREVHAVSRGAAKLAAGRVRPLELDLASDFALDALPPRVEAVVHLAQSPHFREFPERAEHVHRVNALATVRLLEYARRAGARTFVLASTGGVYGHGERPFSEEDPVSLREDAGFYTGTKLAAEAACASYARLLRVIVLRFFFVYGPGQNATMLVPRLIRLVREGAPIVLQGGGDGIRLNPTHASDAARATERALDLPGSAIVNVGGPEVLTLRWMGEAIGRALGVEPRFAAEATTQPRHLVGDIRRMSALLGEPVIRFEDGVTALVRERAG